MSYIKIDIKIAVNGHLKEAQPLQQMKAKESEKRRGRKAKACKQRECKGVKTELHCRSKAKQSPNLTRRTSANVTIPCMEQSLELREGLSQTQVIRKTVPYTGGFIAE